MSFSMRAYRGLLLANLKTYWRNPLAASGLFIMLVLMLGGVRFVEHSRQQPFNVGFSNHATTPAATSLVKALKQIPTLSVTETSEEDANQRLQNGKVDLVVIIPASFGTTGNGGRLEPVAVDVAYKQGGLGQQAAGLVNAAVDQVDRDAQGAAQVFSVRPRVLNASVGVIDTFLPGLLGFNLVNSGLLLAAGIFAGYRSSGVLRRIKVTGTAPINLVLAHATASLILTIVQISLLIVVTMALFTVRLDVVSLLLVSLLGYLVFLALGFAISGWVRDAQRAPVVASSIGMPLIFIALFPPDIFSGVARVAVGLLPISFLTHGLRQIVEGGDLGTVRLDLLGLAVWAVVLLVGAGWTFRWD